MADYGEILDTGEFVPDFSRVSREQMAALVGIEVDEATTVGQDGQTKTMRRYRLKADKMTALDKLARNLGLLTDNLNMTVSGDMADQILKAKQRLNQGEDDER